MYHFRRIGIIFRKYLFFQKNIQISFSKRMYHVIRICIISKEYAYFQKMYKHHFPRGCTILEEYVSFQKIHIFFEDYANIMFQEDVSF